MEDQHLQLHDDDEEEDDDYADVDDDDDDDYDVSEYKRDFRTPGELALPGNSWQGKEESWWIKVSVTSDLTCPRQNHHFFNVTKRSVPGVEAEHS